LRNRNVKKLQLELNLQSSPEIYIICAQQKLSQVSITLHMLW